MYLTFTEIMQIAAFAFVIGSIVGIAIGTFTTEDWHRRRG